jgi:hypothetical protein
MEIVTGNLGWVEVICGPMFSGKSEELIRRLRRSMIARKRVQVFKPLIDTRYSADEIVSHGDLRMKSEVVGSGAEILDRIDWRSGYGLHGPPVRAGSRPAGAGGDDHQDAGYLHALRESGEAHAAPARVR